MGPTLMDVEQVMANSCYPQAPWTTCFAGSGGLPGGEVWGLTMGVQEPHGNVEA